MVIGNYLRPSSFLWTIGQKWLFTTLSLWYRLPYVSLIICKSGLLIFLWAELPCKTVYIPTLCWIKHPRSITAWVPLSFFLFLSLSLSLRLILWSAEARWAHFLVWACKTLARGRPVPTWSSASPVSRALLVICVNQGISASFSLFYFLIVDSRPLGSGPLKDLNIGGRADWVQRMYWSHFPTSLTSIWPAVINSFTLSLCGPILNRPQTCTCWRPLW